MRLWLILAGVNGAMAVGLDAYGWHALEADPFGREMFAFATRYQIYHALALIGVAWLVSLGAGKPATAAGWCLTAGIILFSGTLYVFGWSGELLLAGAAPVGGGLLMVGWALIAVAGYRLAVTQK